MEERGSKTHRGTDLHSALLITEYGVENIYDYLLNAVFRQALKSGYFPEIFQRGYVISPGSAPRLNAPVVVNASDPDDLLPSSS